jgi:2-oxo-4-hydroxy-4-carboxy-5-ureidoimidazoline decarboxylase
MPAGVTLDALNAMDRAAFVAALDGIFEHSPWVAEAAWAERPFGSVEALHAAMVAAVAAALPKRRRGLLEAHPELGGKDAQTGKLTAASTAEQAGAGLDRLETEERQRLADLNRAYRERFGFPFIIAVRGQRDRRAILAALAARLNHDEATESETALAEVAKIAWFRLSDRVTVAGAA